MVRRDVVPGRQNGLLVPWRPSDRNRAREKAKECEITKKKWENGKRTIRRNEEGKKERKKERKQERRQKENKKEDRKKERKKERKKNRKKDRAQEKKKEKSLGKK